MIYCVFIDVCLFNLSYLIEESLKILQLPWNYFPSHSVNSCCSDAHVLILLWKPVFRLSFKRRCVNCFPLTVRDHIHVAPNCASYEILISSFDLHVLKRNMTKKERTLSNV